MHKRKIFKGVAIGTFIIFGTIICFTLLGTVVHAGGLVDETINAENEYSSYALDNYQLDFYVDNSWGWLPWNWGDGIGKQVMYGLYAITNFIWIISLYLSNATGYLIQEAYNLDFISQTSQSIGKNIQTIAGITQSGFSSTGFYGGFLLLLILILGIYVTYTGLLKRETTKAVRALLNFMVVFILSTSFIAYAPDYISKINDFSKDVSHASLEIGTKIVMSNSSVQGQDSVDMIRDSLFSIQVKQPWVLLQFGDTDTTVIGEDRVENLLATSPDTNNGEDRETIVKGEIENNSNSNLTITQTISRLGTVFFIFFFNIGISIFVFLLTGIMIFSQVLFIIYAMFLPISFLLSMIPTFEGMGRKTIVKLFNVIMTRAGITLIITVAFSISTMLYSLAASAPFFMIMFLQIVTFAGIYFKLGDLMSLFSLQSGESQGMGKHLMNKPRRAFHRHTKGFQPKVGSAFSKGKPPVAQNTASLKGQSLHERPNENMSAQSETSSMEGQTPKQNSSIHERPNQNTITPNGTTEKISVGKQLGQTAGNIMDSKNKVVDKAGQVKDQVKATPTQAKYAIHKGKQTVVDNTKDFTNTVTQTRAENQEERAKKRQHQRGLITKKQTELKQHKQKKENLEPNMSIRSYKENVNIHQDILPQDKEVAKQGRKQKPSRFKRGNIRTNEKSPKKREINEKSSSTTKKSSKRKERKIMPKEHKR